MSDDGIIIDSSREDHAVAAKERDRREAAERQWNWQLEQQPRAHVEHPAADPEGRTPEQQNTPPPTGRLLATF
jgi:hypothetical protein